MNGVSWDTIIGVAAYVGFAVAGDLLLARGMRKMGPFQGWKAAELLRFFGHVATTPEVLGGIACLALNFVVLLGLLTWADISLVGPSRAASYLFLTLLARWFLKEMVSPRRWAGVTLVSVGVFFVLMTS